MSILITGATGFIGKRLISALGGKVKILSRDKNPIYETVICNLEKNEIPKNCLDGIETIFHLAGIAHNTSENDKNIQNYKKVNEEATINLAKLAVKNSVKRFIFVSSTKAVGGLRCGKLINEHFDRLPDSAYGYSKRLAEIGLLKIARKSDMHVSIIRPALVYGPEVKGNLKLMIDGIKQGWFPPLPKTGNRRSMIHVDDLVRAIIFLANEKHADGEIFIATDGKEYSSYEIYHTLCKTLDKDIPKWSVPEKLFDLVSIVSRDFADKTLKILGNENYSSLKLKSLGFQSKKSFKDINETDF